MKLQEFLNNINEIVRSNPDSLNFDVIFSKDDEGNAFREIYYTPSLGVFEEREFISSEQLEDYERNSSEINSICIN